MERRKARSSGRRKEETSSIRLLINEIGDGGHGEAGKASKWIESIGEVSSGATVGPVGTRHLQLRIRGRWSDKPRGLAPRSDGGGALRPARLAQSVGPTRVSRPGRESAAPGSSSRDQVREWNGRFLACGGRALLGHPNRLKSQRQPLPNPQIPSSSEKLPHRVMWWFHKSLDNRSLSLLTVCRAPNR